MAHVGQIPNGRMKKLLAHVKYYQRVQILETTNQMAVLALHVKYLALPRTNIWYMHTYLLLFTKRTFCSLSLSLLNPSKTLT
jgi:hypothetical protein